MIVNIVIVRGEEQLTFTAFCGLTWRLWESRKPAMRSYRKLFKICAIRLNWMKKKSTEICIFLKERHFHAPLDHTEELIILLLSYETTSHSAISNLSPKLSSGVLKIHISPIASFQIDSLLRLNFFKMLHNFCILFFEFLLTLMLWSFFFLISMY